MARRRLDEELVRRGLVATRAEAESAVQSGRVLVSGIPAGKPSTLVAPGAALGLAPPLERFVSRGGEKLRAALERFHIDPTGSECLDAGASTGGFTDCLLQAGASAVAAVDVGYGQLAWSLRSDPRVHVFERTNVRDLTRDDLPFAPGIVVADLSFVSLRAVLPSIARLAAPSAAIVLLVKPQFEAPAGAVATGGVVRDPIVWRRVLEEVVEACTGAGLGPIAVMVSPITGPAGNVEFLLHARRDERGKPLDLVAAIDEATVLAIPR